VPDSPFGGEYIGAVAFSQRERPIVSAATQVAATAVTTDVTSRLKLPAGRLVPGLQGAHHSSLVQRACDCGSAAGVSEKCGRCAANERLGLRTKLGIDAPGDRWDGELFNDIYIDEPERTEYFKVAGAPEASGFSYGWTLEAGGESFPLIADEYRGKPAAYVPEETKARLAARERSDAGRGRAPHHAVSRRPGVLDGRAAAQRQAQPRRRESGNLLMAVTVSAAALPLIAGLAGGAAR
jgi:hypothetical protein